MAEPKIPEAQNPESGIEPGERGGIEVFPSTPGLPVIEDGVLPFDGVPAGPEEPVQ